MGGEVMAQKHTMYKNLSCDLTAGEIALYSNELANVTSQQAEIEGEKKEVASDFTAKLNKCIADSRVLARKITTRKEDRQVECDLDFDYSRGMVYIIRADTGVTIDQRKLTDEERQERLDLDGEQDKKQALEEKLEEIDKNIDRIVDEPESATTSTDIMDMETCTNTEYLQHNKTEANHCNTLAMIHECDHLATWLKREPVAVEVVELTDKEKDAICHEWRDCDYTEKCFQTDSGSCLRDDAASQPKPIDQKSVNKLVHTSADDCKISLSFVNDLGVLHAALEACTTGDQKTKAKHISARINQIQKAAAA